MMRYFLQSAGLYSAGEGMAAARQADLSVLNVFGPILALVLVVVLVFALLKKTEILGDNDWVMIIIALVIGFSFVAFKNVTNLVLTVVPWFAVLFIVLFLFLLFAGLIGKTDMFGKGIVWVFVGILGVIFIFSAGKVFGAGLVGYLPGPYFGAYENADPELLFFFDWLYSPAIGGGIVLIAVAITVSWILIKVSKVNK